MTQLHLGIHPDGRDADTARFSACGMYRYELTRELGGSRPLVICGLNPSKATAVKNDQTITKEVGFATRWGLGRLVKVNAYGFIATDPADMKRAAKAGIDIVGPENDDAIRQAAALCMRMDGKFLVAWGGKIVPERQRAIWTMIRLAVELVCLGTNLDGTPVHPLYIPYERQLVPWRMP